MTRDPERLLADIIEERRRRHLSRAVARGIITGDQATELMQLHRELDAEQHERDTTEGERSDVR